MSVINTMLRDLEQRQGQTTDGRYQPPAPARWRQWLAPILLCLSLPVLGWLVWQRWNPPVAQVTSAAVTVSQPVGSPASSVHQSSSASTAMATVPPATAVSAAAPGVSHPTHAVATEAAGAPGQAAPPTVSTVADPAGGTAAPTPLATASSAAIPLPQTPTATAAVNAPVSEEQLLGPDEGPVVTEASLLRSDNTATTVDAGPPGEPTIREQHLSARQVADLERSKGLQALARGDTAQARDAFAQVLRNAPLAHDIRERLVGLLYGDGDLAGARQELATGIRLAPTHADYRLLDARLALAQGDRPAALATLAGLNPPVRDNLDYYATRAGLAQSLGDDAQAIRCYQQLTAARPQEGRWWMGLGISLERVQRSLAAREAYQHAANLTLTNEGRQFVAQRLQQLEK